MALTWNENLHEKIMQKFGKNNGAQLSKKYSKAFPPSYRDEYTSDTSILDIPYLENVNEKTPIDLCFNTSPQLGGFTIHLRLYQWQNAIALSDILPILENFNLRTENEHPHKLTFENGEHIWISDFTVTYSKGVLEIDKIEALFKEAFIKTYRVEVENDGFNKLVLGALLSWREILILRMYSKYLRQVGFRFTQAYIEDAFGKNPLIAKSLVELFYAYLDPKQVKSRAANIQKIEQDIQTALDSVTSLDEDKIIRQNLDVIKATLRTNFFDTNKAGEFKDYVSIKLSSRDIPDLPLPKPLYEIFVYSSRFEGIHLRNTKVARGGIRWSDRKEDFRTEILGLMKAQVVKNAVIVPSGAKGGFVLKAVPEDASRDVVQTEVIACYKSFIKGLLDLTDNIKNNKPVPPANIVCRDAADPYLVVAADKGTANFSDIANSISREYDFWLDDAFASGGSTGYDHKKMGITAKGAWESVKRHFRELEIDIEKHTFTTIGIGDMSGDVFGNGMIYSNKIKLIAAFDHRHIFIDPNPNPATSYKERLRLFNLPISSWEDYNSKLISKGGGIFKRSLKSIAITPEMQKVLAIQDKSLTPTDLIRAILKAPVDLLYNGGIGTYVKASSESNADVGDRTNDYCRIDGIELQCKVVGEGGNLGFTQRGRIEFALKGGLINTDFIDNSAGVDCSDHEVNLKILFNQEIFQKKLTFKKRNTILASLTDEIAKLVLNDNYQQALVMSYTAFGAKKSLSLHANYIKELESLGIINRKVEFLPDEKTLADRKANGESLTRPELAVLLAYTKIHIKQSILDSDLPEDPFFHEQLKSAFPPSISKKYYSAMKKHGLHRDIIATQLSNHLVNEMGITFVYRLQIETGASIKEIIRAYAIASSIYATTELQKIVESLDFKLPMADQYDMLFSFRRLINLSTRWFLHSVYINKNLATIIAHFAPKINNLENQIPTLMSGDTKNYLDSISNEFVNTGLPAEIARRIATYRAIYTSLNIIDISAKHKLDLMRTAEVYFACGERMHLVWFRDQIAIDSREGNWSALARLTLRDELDISQRALTVVIIKNDRSEKDTQKLIQKWIDQNPHVLKRWDDLLNMLNTTTQIDYAMLFIAIRELMGLISTAEHRMMTTLAT